jgi:hypothetical protein
MDTKRWTLGVVLAAAVSLLGLVGAGASPFSSYILSDDLGNAVRGSAPEASNWDDGSGAEDDTAGDGNSGSGAGDSGNGAGDTGSDGSGKSNNGHGNNADGVDSSNPGQGNGGPNGSADASCPEGGTCVDDETKGGGTTSADTTTDTSTDTRTNSGKANGKKK